MARLPAKMTSQSATPPERRIGPAIGMIEAGSLARGMVVVDTMVKRSPVDILESCSVSPGKYIIVVCGEVAEVDEAMKAGLCAAAEFTLDSLMLPQPHRDIVPALRGGISPPAVTDPDDLGAVGIVETSDVAAAIVAADAAAKAADVRLYDMRLARGIGGKAYFCLCGELHEVQAAIGEALAVVGADRVVNREIIARPHPDFVSRAIARSL